MFVTLIFVFENIQNLCSCGISFGLFWSGKYLNFEQKLPIWSMHHTFPENRHPMATKNPCYVSSCKGIQKKVSAHRLKLEEDTAEVGTNFSKFPY